MSKESKLTQILAQLRRSKVIKSYQLETGLNKASGENSEVFVKLTIDGNTLIDNIIVFNPDSTNFSRVTEIAFKEVEDQLLQTGIMSLYSNRTSGSPAMDGKVDGVIG